MSEGWAAMRLKNKAPLATRATYGIGPLFEDAPTKARGRLFQICHRNNSMRLVNRAGTTG